MFAVLELTDFMWIGVLVALLVGASRAAGSYFKPSDGARLRRLEAKVDLILTHLGLEYAEPAAGGLSEEVRALADDPARKIQAIKLLREQTGMGLAEAKAAVEAYVAGRG